MQDGSERKRHRKKNAVGIAFSATMLTDWILGGLLFAGDLLALWGMTRVTALAIERVLHEDRHDWVLPIAFGTSALIPALMGWTGLGMVPYAATGIVLAAGIYGAFDIITRQLWEILPAMLPSWKLWIAPVCIFALFFLSKSTSLIGGVTGGDEIRSTTMTNSFAAAGLMPGHPVALGVPIVYAFYSFELSGLLYLAVGGALYPTIPLLAVALFSLFFAYRALMLIAEEVSPGKRSTLLLILGLIVASADLQGIKELLSHVWPILSEIRINVQPLATFEHAGYHYIYGTATAFLGSVWLIRRLQGTSHSLVLAALAIATGFCYGGIPIAWLAFPVIVGAVVMLPSAIKREGPDLLLECCIGLIVLVLVIAPQWTSFLPRPNPLFAFAWPHPWWFIHPWDEVLHPLRELGRQIVLPLVNYGIIVGTLFLVSPLLLVWILARYRKEENTRLLAIALIAAGGPVILTITESVSPADWVGRGSLCSLLACIILAVALLARVQKKQWWSILGVIIAVQFVSMVFAHVEAFLGKTELSKEAHQIHDQVPLGVPTVLPFSDSMTPLIPYALAGRTALTSPPLAMIPWLPRLDLIPSLFGLDPKEQLEPCSQGVWQSNTPHHAYATRTTSGWHITECP